MLKTIFISYERRFSIYFIELCVSRIRNRCDMLFRQKSTKDRLQSKANENLELFKTFKTFESFANEKKVKTNKLTTMSCRVARTTKYRDSLIIKKSSEMYCCEILNSRSITFRTIKTQIKKLLYFLVRID